MAVSKAEQNWAAFHADPRMREKQRNEIRESWERCYKYGINPIVVNRVRQDGRNEGVLQNADYLMDVARYIQKNMHDLMEPSYAVLVFDRYANVLRIIGEEPLVARINDAGIGRGSVWAEEIVGTNAAALGLNLGCPVVVDGSEHFSRSFINYACAFAPIIERNMVIGGIGILGPSGIVGNHLLWVAKIAARYIVTSLTDERWNSILNRSITEGVLAVNNKNRVFYMNQSCQRILRIQDTSTHNLPLNSIIDENKAENFHFWSVLLQGQGVTDETITFSVGKEKVTCAVTVTPFDMRERGFSGKMIVMQETERLHKYIRSYYTGRGARMTFDDIVGNNPRFVQVLHYAMLAASSNSNVLLLGESGTGKDIVAQAIHNESPRKNGPFLAINCAALPRELIASELFGYDEGAFTGARKGGNVGKFELADQGTILLDEIGDMPFELQATLLRVIEERSIMRIGGTRSIPVNVRIIAATNKDLEAEVARNRFRRDLFYRLGVIRIHIPALRDRPDDIVLLAEHFASLLGSQMGKQDLRISSQVIDVFKRYDWPGNIRELQNIMECAVQIASGSELTPALFSENLLPNLFESGGQPDRAVSVGDKNLKQETMAYLVQFDYNKAKTARALGISRKTLYKRLKEYEL